MDLKYYDDSGEIREELLALESELQSKQIELQRLEEDLEEKQNYLDSL